jgi:prepilin-type N-terminal cleavage/methylation domain-containing protein
VSRLRRQAGFTLIELIVAMTIGTMTVLAVYGVLETTMKQTTRIAGRVNATQRGRVALDIITRQLRSQVCYSPVVPALVSGTDDAVKFHVDLTDGSKPIEQHEIAFDPTARTLTERIWPGAGSPLSFPTRTVNRQITDGIVRRPADVLPGPDQPIFRYYAYNVPAPPAIPKPVTLLPTPLSAPDLGRVAKIEIGFVALPPGTRPPYVKATGASTLQNEVYVRVADPNDPAPTPTCA